MCDAAVTKVRFERVQFISRASIPFSLPHFTIVLTAYIANGGHYFRGRKEDQRRGHKMNHSTVRTEERSQILEFYICRVATYPETLEFSEMQSDWE